MTPEQQIEERAFAVLHDVGADLGDDVRAKLNTAYPPSSKAGESPHRRTGDLRGGIDYLITKEGQSIVLTIVSSMPYSAPLEFGAPSRNLEARPFMGVTLDDWAPVIVQRLQDAYSGPSPVVSPAGAIVPIQTVAA